jgi:hypothetical protein
MKTNNNTRPLSGLNAHIAGLKNSLTKHAKTCPFLRGVDLVALQGIVSRVKKLSFKNAF